MTRPSLAPVLLGLVFSVVPAFAQTDWSKVQFKTTEVGPHIHMIQGAGGNIGVFSGPDGVVVIDDQFAPISDRLLAEIRKISDRPLRFVLNTHWHPDHTGGNQKFSGAGATVIAQDHVRTRMLADYANPVFGWKVEPSPPEALPVLTFSDSASFHMNGEKVLCFHVPNAHTDGDVLVWFPAENVMHAGDVFFNGSFPILDVGTGGTAQGMVDALRLIASVTNDSTKIMSGHTPIGTRADVLAAADVLARVRDRVVKLREQKMTLDQIIETKPLADLEGRWGKGHVNADLMIRAVYLDLDR